MKNKELYSIFIVCLLMMSSCLGDTNTQITVGEQEAVYQTRPTQGFFVEGGRFLYGTNLGVSGNNGDCFLIQYSFDSAAPELQNSDSLSIELIENPVPVDLWPVDKNWTDTTVVLKDEMLTKAITGRDFYIRGRLFLWSTHTVVENQKDSFMISYNPENLYTQEDGKRIYNLYLRAIARIEVGEGEELPKGQQLNLVNAFSVEEFYNNNTPRKAATVTSPINGYIKRDKNSSPFSSFLDSISQAFPGWDMMAITHLIISLYISLFFYLNVFSLSPLFICFSLFRPAVNFIFYRFRPVPDTGRRILIKSRSIIDRYRKCVTAFFFLQASFGGFYLGAYLLNEAWQGLFKREKDMKLCQRFVGYSSSLMFALNVVLMLLPEFFFLRIFILYTFYIVWEGAGPYMQVEEKERLKFAGITTVIILLTPAVIEFVLFMLMPGLRY